MHSQMRTLATLLIVLVCIAIPASASNSFQGPSAAARAPANVVSMVGHFDGTPVPLGVLSAPTHDVDLYVSFAFDSFYAVQNRMNYACASYTSVTGANLLAASLDTPDVQGNKGFCNILGSCGFPLQPFSGNPMQFTDLDHWQSHGDSHGIPSCSPIDAQYLGRFYAANGPIRLSMTAYRFVQGWVGANGQTWNYGDAGHPPYVHDVLKYNVAWTITAVPVQ